MKFLSETFTIKKIPKVVWSSEDSFDFKPKPLTFIFLVFGLFLFGLGESLLITSGAGVGPYTVLAQGISLNVDLSIGTITLFISLGVLLLCFLPDTSLRTLRPPQEKTVTRPKGEIPVAPQCVFVFQRRVCVLLLCTKKRIKIIAKVKKPAIGTFNSPSVCQSPKHIELVRSNTLDLFEVNLYLFITR